MQHWPGGGDGSPGCRDDLPARSHPHSSPGLTPGKQVTLKRQAPLGDPDDIEVRGYHLSWRKSEAAALKVEPISPETI
ncbi:MAG: FeoA domain-containing protein [Cyanobacteria bacterium P01_H01_bin.162]